MTTVLLLALIAWQDFKGRMVSVYVLLGLALVYGYLGFHEVGINALLYDFSVNLIFLALQFFCLIAYFSIKQGKLTNIFDRQIGWGDVAFFIAICFAFSPVNFLMIYVFGLILVAVSFFSLKAIGLVRDKHIPLAGGFSVFLIILEVFDYLVESWNFRDDLFLMQSIGL